MARAEMSTPPLKRAKLAPALLYRYNGVVGAPTGRSRDESFQPPVEKIRL